MDPAQEHRRRVIAAADRAVDEDEHAGLEQRGVGADGRDARDGAGAGDEGGREGVVAGAVVDVA